MGNTLNGVGAPRFRILDIFGNREVSYDLIDCNSEGEPETIKSEGMITRTRLNGRITRKRRIARGVNRLKWTLKYGDLIPGDELKKLETIINASNNPERYRVFLMPYNDVDREFEVFFSSEEFSMDTAKGGDESQGMKVSDLEFTTMDLYDLAWILSTDDYKKYFILDGYAFN